MRQGRLKVTLVLLAMAVVGVHLAFKTHPSPTEIAALSTRLMQSAEWQGKTPPDFELETLTGERFRLSDRVGRGVVVLNFFATWCAPCRVEMPELNRLAAENEGQLLAVLGIDTEERRELVAAFVSEVPVEFPVAIDETGEVGKMFGVESLPTTVVVGADGRIALYQTGMISNVDVAFAGFLEAQLEVARTGQGVSREAYLEAAARETYSRPSPGVAPGEVTLSGRARSIAEAMDCPCGCDHKIAACGCATARRVQARLATAQLDGRADADVIRELNREFCMEEME